LAAALPASRTAYCTAAPVSFNHFFRPSHPHPPGLPAVRVNRSTRSFVMPTLVSAFSTRSPTMMGFHFFTGTGRHSRYVGSRLAW